MSRRRIETITNTTTGQSAKVFRDSEWGEYVVRFYSPEGQLRAAEDYHTEDLGDAQRTARHIVWRDSRKAPRLVYQANPAREVKVGDFVIVSGVGFVVDYFRPPHKPESEGKVQLRVDGTQHNCREFYVSVIGAEWVDRTDR